MSEQRASPWPWLGLAGLILLADQFTKLTIVGLYELGDSTYVTEYFNIVRVHNSGAAFSFLADAGGWQRWFFTAVGVGATGFIVWMLRGHSHERLMAFSLACILGGAVGNVIDRVAYGYVVDFLDFHFRFLEGLFYGGHFPSFNIADAGISIGAVCLILDELLRMRRQRQANRDNPQA
ncbi:MAG: signal peptidase II [Hydrogenophaga sp.]|jgi:signal peptidase II